jgi:hypothetical protein
MPASLLEKQIPERQRMMVMPAAFAAAAVTSIFGLRAAPIRAPGAVLISALALAACFTNWWL